MKTGKTIIYDDSCPLCTWYTGVFTRTGLLDENGRQAFSEIDPGLLCRIDPQRSRNEIPLLDRQTGEVVYGVDALLEVLGSRFPLIKNAGNVRPLKWLSRRLYKLVSYNRRVIVAGHHTECNYDCTPDFNLKYRALFMLISLLFNTWLLIPLHRHVFTTSVFSGTGLPQLQLAHFALVLSNIAIAIRLPRQTAYEYLGQAGMLALITTLLSIPLLFFNQWWNVAAVNNISLAAILLVILREYFRRMQFAGIADRYRLVMPLNFFFLVIFLIYLSN